MEERFEMVAKTFGGLEDVLREELLDLGAYNVETGNRMVTFEGDKATLYRANLCCRTALRILKPLVKFTAEDTDELYDKIRDLPWEQFLEPESTFAIDTTVYGQEFSHSRYVTYKVKDAIVDHFNDIAGKRPSVSVSSPDLLLNVHISGNRVTISMDSSGEPLYKRGYRVAQTEAPINEVLAAGIILKTGWRGDSDFLDPMCGSGTFLIEAALIATNTNPGIYRESFAFEKWKDFDADLFEEIYNDDSAERDFDYKIYGGDIDPEAVKIAKRNVRSAKLENNIEIICQPFTEWNDVAPEGIIVTNPPYGERLKPENIKALYKSFGTTLKNGFAGWNAWVLGYRDEHFAEIGLKPSLKLELLNGNLECSLREYVMFNGKYSEFVAEGGSVANERSNEKEGPRKVRRISDDDWAKGAKEFNKSSHLAKDFRSNKKKDKFTSKRSENHEDRYFSKNERSFGQEAGSFNRKERYGRKDETFSRNDRKFADNYRKERSNDRDFNKKGINSRNEIKPFGKSGREGFKDNRSKFSKVSYNPSNSKKPNIPASKAEIINPVHFRGRKNKSTETEDE